MQCLNYLYYWFQASDENMMDENNPIGKADIKVDSEVFGDDGTRWIIIIC